MKLIELLNKMANREKLPKKILIRDKVYYLINDADGNIVYSQATDKSNWEAFIDHRLNITRCLNEEVLILDIGVEISEDNTIDIDNIEELTQNYFDDWTEAKKINELVQAVKQIDKRVKKLEG